MTCPPERDVVGVAPLLGQDLAACSDRAAVRSSGRLSRIQWAADSKTSDESPSDHPEPKCRRNSDYLI
jgi:hypothetical protein